ncbi:MAG: murein biosynthesis integral membrane protein MurJ [Bacillota bacterium]|nr:murein biosynthesis integral membrane protein MurJ [Bacillota bacterium]
MKSTAKTVGLVMFIMLFSRFLAFAGTAVYMTFYGVDNTRINVYSYAIQFPNIIFNILGTALTIVVIPIFAGYIGTNQKDRAYKFADNITSLSIALTILLSIIGIAIAPLIISLTKFKTDGFDYAVMALQIMFPVMIFYAMNYVLQGILQSLGRFAMPALVSIPSSLIVILYVFLLGGKYGVTGLLIATFIGLAMQALILIPPLYRTDYRFKPSFDYKNEDIKRAFKLIPPILIGTSAYQLNMLFNITITANFKNTVTLMSFVQNTILYSVLAVIYSLTAVIFPKLTMLAARGEMDNFKLQVLKVLKTVVFLLIPAAAGFIAVRYQLISFLVGWGKITSDNISLASSILALYALGVTGIGIKEVTDRAFYSLKDTIRPAINGVIIMLVNIVASLVLISVMGVLGIPLAYSISGVTGAVVILTMLRKKTGSFGGRSLLVSLFKVAAASMIMFGCVVAVNYLLGKYTFGGILVDRGIKLIIPVIVGGTVYMVASCLLGIQEATSILYSIRKRLKRA